MNTETGRNELVISVLEDLIERIKSRSITNINFEMKAEAIKNELERGRSGYMSISYTILRRL